MAVYRECVHITAGQQSFQFGLRRHRLEYPYLCILQMAADKKFLRLSFHCGNFDAGPIDIINAAIALFITARAWPGLAHLWRRRGGAAETP